MSTKSRTVLTLVWMFAFAVPLVSGEPQRKDASPRVEEQQLPFAMHAPMKQRPTITVGLADADLNGGDNRVLQAAVDYIASLGGGTVEIGPGEFMMCDSLHLRTNVTVRGVPGATILRKADAAASRLVLDGDFGEQQVTLEDPTGFHVGAGVAVLDDNAGGFHTTVARITGQSGNTFAIDKPLMSDCMVRNNARTATVFPVVSGYDVRGAHVEGLTIEGNRENNEHLNGCRGAGIFLYRGFGTHISNCIVRNYNGDGISFQQSNDVTVTDCLCENNSHLGFHPGSGSQRPTVRRCMARNNGTDGLFLCWRVRHGVFEENVLEQNGRYGISIGHKDSDNLLHGNEVRGNASHGVYFRNETLGMAAHRNRLIDNLIEDNGRKAGTAAICIRGETNGLVFEGNVIRDTRDKAGRTQTIGVLMEEQVGSVTLIGNRIEAEQTVYDRRTSAAKSDERLQAQP